MFDHITLRVADLVVASSAFTAVLDDELEIERTTRTPSFSVWGNFALTQTDEEHPIARRVHIAFIAPTPAHVDRFGQVGIDAGFADDGPAGPRPDYAEDYDAAIDPAISPSGTGCVECLAGEGPDWWLHLRSQRGYTRVRLAASTSVASARSSVEDSSSGL